MNFHAAPPEQRGEIRLLNLALVFMGRYVERFASAIDLFEYSRDQSSASPRRGAWRFRAWQSIAARDAVMSIFHFRNAMLAANNFANTLSHVVTQLNRRALGEAHSLFERLFPDFVAMRQSVAHAGELYKTKAKADLHKTTGEYIGPDMYAKPGVVVQDSLEGNRYTCTFDGKIVHCEVSTRTMESMVTVRDLFHTGFPPPP